jgi:hypothetical protein
MTKTVSVECLPRARKWLVPCTKPIREVIVTENKRLPRVTRVTLGCTFWRAKCDRVYVAPVHMEMALAMTQNNDPGMMEEVVLPEHLLPLGSVLGPGVSSLDLCMVLAKIFRVQYSEVALMRLDKGLLRFVFPEYLRTTGAIPLSSKAVAAHTALSKKAEIFNNFARVKHASIFETIKPGQEETEETAAPPPIQKLMSVPIMDQDSNVVGVIQISRKALDPKFAQDFSREDLHDLELVAGLLATAPALLAN